MAAMAMNPSSPAPSSKLRTPPYHHSSPSAEEEPMATPPPKPTGQRSPLPSPLQLSGGYSLHELMLLSPSPTSRRTRSGHRGAAGAGGVDSSLEMAGTPPRRRRATPAAASPRNARRARRRLEKETDPEEEAVRKARRRRSSRVASKVAAAVAVDKGVAAAAAAAPEKEDGMILALVPAPADATHVTGSDAPEQSGWESLWERIVELVLWKEVAKSALWFGLGSMFFLSCSFSREITFSPISVFCQLGVMILGLAFFKDSVPQRQPVRERNFELTEKDLLRAAGAVLPIANSIISTVQVIFSGNPSMTLKVLPVLLFGAKYGSVVTVWRLLATGFFTSFTLPKLYICYSIQIHIIAENLIDRALEAWKSCPRKKFVAGTAVTVCWNLFSVKTRFVAAFISVVILRYNHQTAGLM